MYLKNDYIVLRVVVVWDYSMTNIILGATYMYMLYDNN